MSNKSMSGYHEEKRRGDRAALSYPLQGFNQFFDKVIPNAEEVHGFPNVVIIYPVKSFSKSSLRNKAGNLFL